LYKQVNLVCVSTASQIMTTVGRQKTYTVLLCRLTALQQTLKSTVKMPNHCKAVEAGMQVRHACSCCAHAVLMLCSCCAVTGSRLLHRRQVDRFLPGGQVSLIQNILMRRLVIIHKVAVGHVCQVFTVAMLAILWRYYTICD